MKLSFPGDYFICLTKYKYATITDHGSFISLRIRDENDDLKDSIAMDIADINNIIALLRMVKLDKE